MSCRDKPLSTLQFSHSQRTLGRFHYSIVAWGILSCDGFWRAARPLGSL
jgi:hypothetical protein